ncbi:MAG TPA: cupin domain-containing protein, partial [Ramlibacter sp.]|nr:cupin domain-containing protein [Ramlibacter sp.]
MDVLSDVLQKIRIQGALFLNTECHEPWCMQVPEGPDLAKFLYPQAERLIICHTVLEGRCWIQPAGGEPVALNAGDAVTL